MTCGRGSDFYDRVFLLKHSPCNRALALVIQPIWICAVLHQKLDEVGVAVVSSKHELFCLWVLLSAACMSGDKEP